MTGVVWLTGIEASGKTTLADALARRLARRGVPCEVLDGDDMRRALSADLGYSDRARDEHTRRVAWVAALLAKHGVVAIVALVSPARAHRDRARGLAPRFAEVHVQASASAAESRDPKGLYARAHRGEVADVVGLLGTHEAPLAPEVVCDTERAEVAACVAQIERFLDDAGWIKRGAH